jgi:hypothetical protein
LLIILNTLNLIIIYVTLWKWKESKCLSAQPLGTKDQTEDINTKGFHQKLSLPNGSDFDTIESIPPTSNSDDDVPENERFSKMFERNS